MEEALREAMEEIFKEAMTSIAQVVHLTFGLGKTNSMRTSFTSVHYGILPGTLSADSDCAYKDFGWGSTEQHYRLP